MKFPFRQFVLAAAVAVCAGCATSRVAADPRLVIDPSAKSVVEVLAVDYGQAKTGAPTVAATVKNRTSSVRRLEWRVVWIDANGRPDDSLLAAWKRFTLDPREITDLHSTSPRKDASGFRLEVRKAP